MLGYVSELWKAELLPSNWASMEFFFFTKVNSHCINKRQQTLSLSFVGSLRCRLSPLVSICFHRLKVESVFVGSWNVWEVMYCTLLSSLICVCRWPFENMLFSSTQPMKLPQSLTHKKWMGILQSHNFHAVFSTSI